MEEEAQSPQQSEPPLPENHEQLQPSPSTETHTPQEEEEQDDTPPPPAGDASPPPRKRRRRKKQFPEMVPSAAAVEGLRALRHHHHHPKSNSVYDDKVMDEILQFQINQSAASSSSSKSHHRRRSKFSDLAREVDVEALIAISVGFPVDSLTEEEIESNVVAVIGGADQANYIVVRNHILARWRSNVSVWLTREHALESIRSEHSALVGSAYNFLLEHGYINFGLAPAIKEACFARAAVDGAEKANVIIVGAGLAGLTAARQLISLGFKVVILEGRNRPGGRVRTKKMSGGDGVVVAAADLGGSVLTGINGNPLGVLARQLGFPLHKVRDICPLYLPNGKAVDPEMDSRVENSFNKLLDKVCKIRQAMLDEVKTADMSLGSAYETFRRVFKVAVESQERMLLNWHLANLEYANASLLSDLSMSFWDQDDPYEMGGDHCFIPGGNGRFIWALAENLPIFYDRNVETIQYGMDGVMVYAGGQVYRGDMVLCTVPLGVLKRGSIRFVPELPTPKQEAIQRLGFGLLNKVAMLFPYDFWGGSIDTFGHLTEDSSMRGEFFLFYSYSSVSGGPLLVALVAGESAIKFEKMSPIEAVERVLDVLRGIFAPKGIRVPAPLQVVCTRWGKDKFTYGSYSYVAVGASGDDYDILADSVGNGRVFFAGEATNRRYPATMHGAFLSGLREAANISRAASRRSSIHYENFGNAKDYNNFKDINTDGGEYDDLKEIFEAPNLSFGSFSILFDPGSVDDDSVCLARVRFGGEKLSNVSLYLYGLILRRQVMQLNEIDGDANRVQALSRDFGVKLVGRNGLGAIGESLIASLKATRINHNVRSTGALDRMLETSFTNFAK